MKEELKSIFGKYYKWHKDRIDVLEKFISAFLLQFLGFWLWFKISFC